MAIMVESGARTAEGVPVDIHPEDPLLATTYPNGEQGPNGYSAPLGGGASYFFSTGSTTLVRDGQACFN